MTYYGRLDVIVLFQLHCLLFVLSEAAPLNVNNFFNDLTGSAMNSINPLGKLPNAMTMSKQCKFGADMSRPIQYMQMDAMSGSPLSSYIGGNRQCPCMMTVDASGCPVCNCKDQKATPHVMKTPVPSQRQNLRRYTTKTRPSSTTYRSTNVKAFDRNSQPTLVSRVQTSNPSKYSYPSQSTGRTSSRGDEKERKPSEEERRTSYTTVQAQYIPPPVMQSYSFPLFILFSCTTVLTSVSSIVLFYLWKKSKKTLKHEKNELYFVQKSIRNSSMVSSLLESDGTSHRDSIYSHVDNSPSSVTRFDSNFSKISPILPPRTPPSDNPCLQLTPTAPPLTPVAGQTSFKFPPDDIRHDYLELI